MDNKAFMLDCPVCLQPLTSINGVKPDLIATTCGHLFHEKCLPRPKYKFQPQQCMSCNKIYRYGHCLKYYPQIAESEQLDHVGLADNYNALVSKLERLEVEIGTELAETVSLKKLVDQNTKRQLALHAALTRQCIKRKLSKSDEKIKPQTKEDYGEIVDKEELNMEEKSYCIIM